MIVDEEFTALLMYSNPSRGLSTADWLRKEPAMLLCFYERSLDVVEHDRAE